MFAYRVYGGAIVLCGRSAGWRFAGRLLGEVAQAAGQFAELAVVGNACTAFAVAGALFGARALDFGAMLAYGFGICGFVHGVCGCVIVCICC